MSKLQNHSDLLLFSQSTSSIILSTAEKSLMPRTSMKMIEYLNGLTNVFVKIAECICLNQKMYLSKLLNCKIPVIFSYSPRVPLPSLSAPQTSLWWCVMQVWEWTSITDVSIGIVKCICPNQKKIYKYQYQFKCK